MTRAPVVTVLLLAAGCAAPPPLLFRADANHVVIKYSGDLAAATALAERQCAGYQRVAKLTDTDLDTAYFACVPP
jgi:hypothetical protein